MTTGKLVALALAAGVPLALEAQPRPIHDDGRARAEAIAMATDRDADGLLSWAELERMSDDVFASMDEDTNGTVDRDEFAAWRYGMADLADFRDRAASYETTMAFVFDVFDRDNDEAITEDEHEEAVRRSHDYADLDGDGALTIREYLDGFIFNIAMRSAVVGPDLRRRANCDRNLSSSHENACHD